VNEDVLYWPRTPALLNQGDLIRPLEDFDRDIYFEWSLYAIGRNFLGEKEEASLTTILHGIMTGGEEAQKARELEGTKRSHRKQRKRGFDTHRSSAKKAASLRKK